jgi:hypothetical protein
LAGVFSHGMVERLAAPAAAAPAVFAAGVTVSVLLLSAIPNQS